MIFTSFDAADISALKYVKKKFLLWERTFKKAELQRVPKKLFVLGTLTVRGEYEESTWKYEESTRGVRGSTRVVRGEYVEVRGEYEGSTRKYEGSTWKYELSTRGVQVKYNELSQTMNNPSYQYHDFP